MNHKHTTSEWSVPGYAGRVDCACCGFSMLGENRVLTIRPKLRTGGIKLCDGCVNAIAEAADGREISMCGRVMA